jgi:hypothetical protein
VAGSPYAITPSAAVGTGLSNYTISYVNGNLTVNPAALTITANNMVKTYGTTYTFPGTEFTDVGLVNGDTVTSVTLTSPGAAAGATVAGSPYAITPSTALGHRLSNYTISYVNGQFTVNPAVLTITAKSFNKTVGTAYTFAGTEFNTVGLKNADTVSSVTLASAGAPAPVADGPYIVTASNALGTGLGNYAIAYDDGVLTVVPVNNPPPVVVPPTVGLTVDQGGGNSIKPPHGSLQPEVPINLCLSAAPQDTLADPLSSMLDLIEISPELAATLPYYKIQTHLFSAFHTVCSDAGSPSLQENGGGPR